MGPDPIWLCPHKKGKFGHTDKHVQREDNVKTQGECHPQAKEHRRPPKARREACSNRSSLPALRRNQPGWSWSQISSLQNCETINFCCSIDRWTDKEDVVYIHNRILPSRKKEWNNVFCCNMDGPKGYYTKWSKSKTNII